MSADQILEALDVVGIDDRRVDVDGQGIATCGGLDAHHAPTGAALDALGRRCLRGAHGRLGLGEEVSETTSAAEPTANVPTLAIAYAPGPGAQVRIRVRLPPRPAGNDRTHAVYTSGGKPRERAHQAERSGVRRVTGAGREPPDD